MKRLLAILLGVVLVAAVVGVVFLVRSSDGPTAFTASGASVSQATIDDELRNLDENKELNKLLAQPSGASASTSPGSLSSEFASSWVSLRINQVIAAQTVKNQGITITSEDIVVAQKLALQIFDNSQKVVAAFPQDFQEELVSNLVPVAALIRVIRESPSPTLVSEAKAQCPSGRYVSHILVGTQEEAATLLAQINAGADFATLAQQYSTDGSAAQGGGLGCVDGAQFVEPFATVAATQAVGTVSNPVQTEFGFHLIKVTDDSDAALTQLILERVLSGSLGTKVSLDPRYGTFDPRTGTVIPPKALISAPSSSVPLPAIG
ncbi:MAG: peptidylprolyl isomerase [Acidimicrobiia bacterium]|nr:peptidylprolyl isomerase [Acidimicrobiia bacterium]